MTLLIVTFMLELRRYKMDTGDTAYFDEEFTVKINNGDVFINGEQIAQLCYNADSVGYAIANYLVKGNTFND